MIDFLDPKNRVIAALDCIWSVIWTVFHIIWGCVNHCSTSYQYRSLQQTLQVEGSQAFHLESLTLCPWTWCDNNLLKHLPADTLKILKDILNNIWTTGDFPHQWRAATVIPIPKPNKDHADPNSYRPIALTSCLCKILEHMINTRFIWYLEKSGILDRSQCGFRKHRSTVDHLVSLERYVRMPLHRNNRRLVSSSAWRRLMNQPGSMVSSETCTG